MNNIKIGDRICVGRDRGTVRYIGVVEGYQGDWVGVDWDDPKRGKHDGTLNGRKYFSARSSTSGSFVRSSKVETGRRITDEMQSKYVESFEMDQHDCGPKIIQMVGLEKTHTKQKNLWKLGCIVLDDMLVSRPPAPDCPPFERCTELNLYNNLISTWKDLVDILDFFPSLLYLNVRRNIMESNMESISDESRKVNSPIFHVVLSECRIDQHTAQRVMKLFPKLAELYLTNNGLEYFDPGDGGDRLTLLDLEANPINDFKHLHNLAALPRLESLNLTECGITSIEVPDTVGFPALETLNIRDNRINDWESVNELEKLPSLRRVFYKGCWEVKPERGLLVREVLIAKLPKLLDLERCDISAVERRSAEMLFLNKYAIPPVIKEHAGDIERLKKIHGEPDVVKPTKNFGLSLMKLNLSLDGKSVQCSLPTSTTVQRVKSIVSRMFHLNPTQISLAAQCGSENFRYDMDNPLRSISFYELSDGDTVLITVKS